MQKSDYEYPFRFTIDKSPTSYARSPVSIGTSSMVLENKEIRYSFEEIFEIFEELNMQGGSKDYSWYPLGESKITINNEEAVVKFVAAIDAIGGEWETYDRKKGWVKLTPSDVLSGIELQNKEKIIKDTQNQCAELAKRFAKKWKMDKQQKPKTEDVPQEKISQTEEKPSKLKPPAKTQPEWVMPNFEPPGYLVTLKGHYNEEKFKQGLKALVDSREITDYKSTINGFELTAAKNKIIFDIKENRIYATELTLDTYMVAAKATMACGYSGWDMKELVAAVNDKREGAKVNLENAYAAGKAQGSNFKFTNLPKKLEEELELNYQKNQQRLGM